ncbi:hypothetical protein Btru_066592 [Bulinus truncatus]|nr:hypothetical protein Btru_066592 [Bulinus truncatus]
MAFGSGGKKRKLDAPEAGDDWDDDIAFTQDELETLDVMASQAILQSQVIQPAMVTMAPPSSTYKNSSTSSSNGAHLYPSNKSRSLSLSNSSNHSSNERLGSNGQAFCSNLEQEINNLKDERNRYVGEVKYMKDIARSQEAELERLRAQIEELKETQKLAQNNKIQNLETDLEKLTFEKQFKDREIEELQKQYQSLHQKLRRLEVQHQKSQQIKTAPKLTQSPEKSSPKKVTVQPSPPSLKHQKLLEGLPASQQQNFPTYHSFVKQTAGPDDNLKPENNLQKNTPKLSDNLRCTKCCASLTKCSSQRLALNIGSLRNKGNIVATNLLKSTQASCNDNGDMKNQIWDPGLIRLLNDASFAAATSSNGSKRIEESLVLRSKSHSKQIKKKLDDWQPHIVTKEHYQLAVDGLLYLLDEQNLSNTSMLDDGCPTSLPCKTLLERGIINKITLKTLQDQDVGEAVYQLMNGSHTQFVKEQSRTCQALTNLIPLLFDYIHHYIQLSETESYRMSLSHSSSSNSSFSVSTPSSIEMWRSFSQISDVSPRSLSSSLMYLLSGENKVSDNNIAILTSSSLQILAFLLQCCPEMGWLIFSQSFSRFAVCANEKMELDQTKKHSSSGDADDEQSASSVETLILVDQKNSVFPFMSQGKAPCLLQSIVKLARLDLEDDLTNPVIVNHAIKCLTNLIQCVPKQHIYKLEKLIPFYFLSSCFKQTKFTSIYLSALKLMDSLASCEKLLEKMCAKSENCPLHLVHRLCSHSLTETLPADKTAFYQQLVVAVVRVLYEILSCYKSQGSTHTSPQCLLKTLTSGVYMLSTLAQGDIMFAQHYSPVQLTYAKLVTELEKVFRSQTKDHELILLMLEELNIFELDSSDASQDMEADLTYLRLNTFQHRRCSEFADSGCEPQIPQQQPQKHSSSGDAVDEQSASSAKTLILVDQKNSILSFMSQGKAPVYYRVLSNLPGWIWKISTVNPCLNAVLYIPPFGFGRKPDIHATLTSGVYMLSTLAQGDIMFAQHYSPVQLTYAKLVTELEKVFRSQTKDHELILLMLEELNIFELDSSDASQDMEAD